MLNLAAATAPDWAERALRHLPEILLDHAHCEKKAASTAVGLLFRYPEHGPLLVPLSRLGREELGHFEEVLGHLGDRGVPFARLPPSPYAASLCRVIRGREPDRVIDTLLCCALIEARSCERLRLLGAALEARGDEPVLARLYRGLVASEARHHQAYVDMALSLGVVPAPRLRARLGEIARHEAQVLAEAPRTPRLHNG
jgi:tRNA 2-(methylsulfanyl)-N6-isopentenyladenosine37 hydroxylase